MCAVLDTPFETFDNLDFEDRIHRAYEESIEQQTCLPLIKQELQCKIQCDRLSRGESELVLGEEPPKSFELTDEEIRKRDARLEQNRRSALRSRQNAKKKEETLKKNLDRLFNEQRQLAKEVKGLKEEKKMTLAKLKAHLEACGNKKKRIQLSYELMLH